MKRFLFIISAILVFFTPLAAYSFDAEPTEIDITQGSIADQHVQITTIGTAIGSVYCEGSSLSSFCKQKTSFILQGSGFVIGDYVITAAHVVDPDDVTAVSKGGGAISTSPLQVLSRTIVVNDDIGVKNQFDGGTPAEIYYISKVFDLAILKLSHTSDVEPIPYEIGYTYEMNFYGQPYEGLFIGMPVASIVRVRNEDDSITEDFEVRTGKIISTHVAGDVQLSSLQGFGPLDFTMDMDVIGGDSGSAVFGFVEGVPVVIGVLRAGRRLAWGFTHPGLSYAARIDGLRQILNLYDSPPVIEPPKVEEKPQDVELPEGVSELNLNDDLRDYF